MNETLAKVLNYEKRLIQDRQELLALIAEAEGTDSELLDYKLECFHREIAFMNHQVELLKQEAKRQPQKAMLQNREQVTYKAQVVNEENTKYFSKMDKSLQGNAKGEQQVIPQQIMAQKSLQPQVINQVMPTNVQDTQNQAMGAQAARVQAQYSQAQSMSSKSFEKRKTNSAHTDFEKTIGKSLMGILASVLIFISLILFATLLLPYFNDTAKMVTTYVISFVFLGIGLVKLKKDRENKFYLALTGCGIGAVYISLLLSNMYFKRLGDIPLYVLIGIWGIGVCLFARQQKLIFQIIGELGILISMLFGCILCAASNDAAKFLALIIFYGISSGVFYFVHYKEEFVENLLHHCFHSVNCFLVVLTCIGIVEPGFHQVAAWLVLLLLLASVGIAFWHKQERDSICFGIFVAIYLVMTYGILSLLCNGFVYHTIVIYAVTVMFMVLFEQKKVQKKAGIYIAEGVLSLIMLLILCFDKLLYNYGMVPMMIVPLLIAGFYRKNFLFKYMGLAFLTWYTCFYYFIDELTHFGLVSVAFIIAYALMYHKKEIDDKGYKIFVYIITVLFMLGCNRGVPVMAVYGMFLIFITLLEWHNKGSKEVPYIVEGALILAMVSSLTGHEAIYNYGMIPMLFIPLLIAGFYRRNILFQYSSIVLLAIYTFYYFSDIAMEQNVYLRENVIHFLLESVGIVVAYILLYRKKEQYNKLFKYFLHVITVFFIVCCTGDVVCELCTGEEVAAIVTYVLANAFNLGMRISIFGRNLVTKEKEATTVYDIINLFAMLFGLGMIHVGSPNLFWHVVLILAVLVVFMVNAKNLLDRREHYGYAIYVGIKFTILVIVILKSFESASFVFSIACFALAIASIVIGFAGQYRALRVYGLVLSMISTFKLIMVDISYDNTLGNAVSFFVSGILCFVISLIYNYIDGRMKNKQE